MNLGTEMVRHVWGIEQSVLQQMRTEVSTLATSPLARGREMVARQAPAQRTGGGSIGLLSLTGVILQRPSAMSQFFGGTSCQQFSAQLRDMADDNTVDQILIDIDSPGGSVFGVGELAGEVMAARVSKPVVGFINSQCASAAYWIGSACSQLICTPGGETGSIGVYEIHEDDSEALKAAGIAITMISAGKYKAEAAPFGPLSPEARGFKQSRVDDYYKAFTGAVARGRGVSVDKVRGGMGQGRMLGAKAALAEGMIDGIGTANDVISGMVRNARNGNRNASVIAPRGRLAAMKREVEIITLEAGGVLLPTPRLAAMRREIEALTRGA